MSNTSFDTLTNVAADLNGQITEVEILDSDMDPNHVLSRDRAWSVKVKWQIGGLCAPGIGGDWQIRVNLESMGAGFEGTVKEESLPVNSAAPARTRLYEKVINLPRPADVPNLRAGTYKPVIVITHTYTGAGVTKRTRMAGFYEGYILDFVDADV